MRWKYYIIIVVLLWFSFPSALFAVSLSASTLSQNVHTGDSFSVDVVVNTNEYEINAVSGKIFYDPAILTIESIWDGNSIVSLWVERPEESTSGEILFSGTIPGGFEGRGGHVFTLIFSSQIETATEILFQDLEMLTNERNPKVLSVPDKTLPITISSDTGLRSAVTSQDTTSPTSFVPEIAHGPDIFDGQYFLIFHTTDDASGIAYYEVLETSERLEGDALEDKNLPWKQAHSPMVLSDQTLSDYIYVRAVDKVGNYQIAEVFPGTDAPSQSYENLIILGIIVVLLGLVLFRYRFIRRKKQHERV